MGEELTAYWTRGPGAIDLTAASGWCAPSDTVMDLFDPARIREWPAGLTDEDLDWLARMLAVAEIDPDPVRTLTELPQMSVRRGGLTFPV